VNVHAAARRLLTVAQRGVEDRDPWRIHGNPFPWELSPILGVRGSEEKFIIFT
jgi:hypothetical protein